jgi:DNA replication protein DnaC
VTTTTEPRTELERLDGHLKRLALHTVAQIAEEEARTAAAAQMSDIAFLTRLVDAEIAAKADRSVQARISIARFPVLRTREEFDFAFQPSLSAARVREVAELGFLDRAENTLVVGAPGVGKTHRASALGLKACQARKRVLVQHAPALLEHRLAAEVSHTLGKHVEMLGRLDLLIVDELGDTPMDAHRANLFFQLVSPLDTRASIVLTSNVPFDQWGRVFGGDEVIASAILDRLLHFSHVFPITGPSYRVKDKLKGLPDGGTP